jgi:hypothetical protein
MDSVMLALRGLRWRSGASLTVFLVAVVAMAGSALGPLYAHSAADSLVRESLATAAPVTTGVENRGSVAGQTQFTPAEILAVVADRAADPRLDPWFGPPTLSLIVRNGSPTRAGEPLGLAEIGWHQGQCAAVLVVDGRCPTVAGEAMVSARTAVEGRLALGEEIRLGASADVAADTVTIVGTYDPLTADPQVWGLGSPDQARPGSAKGEPDRLDEILVDQATLELSRGDVTAGSFRPLDAGTVHLADLPALSAAVLATTDNASTATTEGPRTVATSGLLGYLAELEPERDGVAAASFAVSVQLVLLAWFVLFLLVSAMSDERAGEIALAKLRGMSRRATVTFGLAEPVLLLLLAIPVGLLIAWAGTLWLTERFLAPGSEVVLTSLTLGALALCLLGGVAAAALAARGILTAPVLAQLRRSGGRRARLARSAAIDAIAVALAVAGIYQLRRGESDALALLTPGLIALAVGLLAARAMPVVARASVGRTRRSSHVASFLASRNIARRPAGLRILVLLSLAVGLAVFAIDGWAVASSNRVDQARALVGATTVLQVRASSPGALLAAVEAADPTGSHAMAAATVSNGQGGFLAVDTARLPAVAAWDPEWIGRSMADTVAWLHPASATPSVPLREEISLRTSLEREEGNAAVALGIVVRDASGRPSEVTAGPLPDGSATATVSLPMCIDAPCTLVGFTLRQPIDRPSSRVLATLGLSDAADADGAVDLSVSGVAGWRPGIATTAVPIGQGADVMAADGGNLVIAIDVERGDAGIEIADRPAALPVVQGNATDRSAASTRVSGLDGRFIDTESGGFGLLPRLGDQGTLADLRYALAATSAPAVAMSYQVWLAADAPASIRGALEQQGLTVIGEESIADRLATLERSGEALALRLFVITALVALGLAAGTLLAHAFIMIRRRAYELSALKALGASHALLVRSGRRELLVLGATGVVLGVVSGLAAAGAALPTLLGAARTDAPPAWFGPAWIPVLVLALGTLALLAVIADVSARRTARRATPDLLRQVQE